MALAKRPKREIQRTGFLKSKSMLLPGTSLASIESLSVPLVQEVELLADIRCVECQKRVADIMSKMNATDSISVNVLEKKVTLTCRYAAVKVSTKQMAAVCVKTPGKIAMIKQMFRSSCT